MLDDYSHSDIKNTYRVLHEGKTYIVMTYKKALVE